MNKSNIIIGGIAILALFLGGFSLLAKEKTSTAMTQTVGNIAQSGTQANLPNPSNSDYAVSRLALGFGTNLSNPAGTFGNINIESQAQQMTAGTTTACIIQNPFNATSTLMSFVGDLQTGISGGATFAIGTTTSGIGTSTNMLSVALATGVGGLMTWDPGVQNAYIAPLGSVVVGYTGASATGTPFTINGYCQAMFQSVI